MERELKKFGVLQMGKVLGVLYGFISVIMLPFFLIVALLSRGNAAALIPMIVMLLLYPVMGFIGGIIMAALYNLAAHFVGGLRFALEDCERGYE